MKNMIKYLSISYILLNLIILLSISLKGYIKETNINKGGVKAPPYINNKEAYKKILTYTKDESLSEIICDTKYPYVLAAIAKIESDYDANALNKVTKAKGLFQIMQKHWGYVPKHPAAQIFKAERVYTNLLSEHKSFNKATERWNGSGREARLYAKQVYKVQKQIENIDV